MSKVMSSQACCTTSVNKALAEQQPEHCHQQSVATLVCQLAEAYVTYYVKHYCCIGSAAYVVETHTTTTIWFAATVDAKKTSLTCMLQCVATHIGSCYKYTC